MAASSTIGEGVCVFAVADLARVRGFTSGLVLGLGDTVTVLAFLGVIVWFSQFAAVKAHSRRGWLGGS